MAVHTHAHTHILPYIDNKNKFYIIILVQKTCHEKQKKKLNQGKDTSKEKTKEKIQVNKKDESKIKKKSTQNKV